MAHEMKKIAVACIIEQKGEILFIKRVNTGFGDGFYMLPGGHVDAGETILHAAVRELKEELGIDVQENNLDFRLVETSQTHISFFFQVKKFTGKPQNMEPTKHEKIQFLSLESKNIHPSTKKELDLLRQNCHFSQITI